MLLGEFFRASEDAVRLSGGTAGEKDLPAHRIAGQKKEIHAFVPGSRDVIKHLPGPVLVMADRKKRSGAQQPAAVSVGVEVGRVRDIVAVLLHPIRERKLPL